MPPGTGRGDGDQGSKPNLHIGYLSFSNNKKVVFKPYIRSSSKGRRLKPNGTIKDFKIRRYYLIRCTESENSLLENRENLGEVDKGRQYIKIAEIVDSPSSNNDVFDNKSLDEKT